MSYQNSTVEFESLNRLSQNLKTIPEQAVLPSTSSEPRGVPSKSPAQLYFNTHQILEHIEVVVNELANTMPTDPYLRLQEYFMKLRVSPSSAIGPQSTKSSLSVEVLHHSSLENAPAGSPKSQIVETKLPADEVDHTFPSYLSNLASSVRRGTS